MAKKKNEGEKRAAPSEIKIKKEGALKKLKKEGEKRASAL